MVRASLCLAILTSSSVLDRSVSYVLPLHSKYPPRRGWKVKTQQLSHERAACGLRATVNDQIEATISSISEYFPESMMINKTDITLSTEVDSTQAASTMPDSVNPDTNWVELAALGTWIASLSSFLLINNYVGPWPSALFDNVPVQYFGLAHALGGMMFAGGIVLTTMIEWLVVSSKQPKIFQFWFDKAPGLDSLVVLPALTTSILSGVGLAVDHYDRLGDAPFHVVASISTLLAFAVWWAATDLTTQSAANEAVKTWSDEGGSVPSILNWRRASNVVSCGFVFALYAIMVLKPGFPPS